jgi:hypothetical protein
MDASITVTVYLSPNKVERALPKCCYKLLGGCVIVPSLHSLIHHRIMGGLFLSSEFTHYVGCWSCIVVLYELFSTYILLP